MVSSVIVNESLAHLLRLATDAGDADGLACAGRLAAAIAERSAASAKGGAKGGQAKGSGPAGSKGWVHVVGPHRDGYAQIKDVAEYLDLTEGSLTVYLARKGGSYEKMVDYDMRVEPCYVRRLGDAERALLKQGAVPEGDQLWTAPVERGLGARRKVR